MDFASVLLNHNFIILVISIVIAYVIYYYKKNYLIWKAKGVDGPTPLPFIGNAFEYFFSDFPTFYMKNLKKYGTVYGYYEGTNIVICVANTELLKQICVTDFHCFTNRRGGVESFGEMVNCMISAKRDDEWRRMRSYISIFTPEKIKATKPLIEKCVRNANHYLTEMSQRGAEVELKKFWENFTLEVIASFCFNKNINSHNDRDNSFTKMALKLGMKSPIKFLLYFVLPGTAIKRLPFSLLPNDAIDYFENIVSQLLKDRADESKKENDFLQLLIEAGTENENKMYRPLTKNEIVAQCITFFFAGYETISTLLQWTCYCLAKNQEIQQKLYEELKMHFSSENEIDYDKAMKIEYLDAVVCETLRMFPPIVFTERRASENVQLENIGITIPAKTLVTIPIYAVHHNSEYYPEPELYKPERFLPGNRENINPYAYMPFGHGPRNCVAINFALAEAKFALIHTLLRFKIVESNKTPNDVKFKRMNMFLTSKKDIFVKFVVRKN